MLPIKKKYIVNEANKKIAVQLDLSTYEKIEQLLEDYALGQLLIESLSNTKLNQSEAETFYKNLPKTS